MNGEKWLTQERVRRALWASAMTLLFLAVGHGFGYLNLIYSGSGVMVDASLGRAAQIAAGRWALPLYWMVRGGISAPLLVGLLSGVYLAASAALVATVLHIEGRPALTLLAGALCLHPAVLAINAAALNVADAKLLALFLCLLGAALSARGRWLLLPAAVCWGAGAALEPDMVSAGVALVVLVALRELLSEKPAGTALRTLLRGLLTLAAGTALYLLGWMLFARRAGIACTPVLCPPISAQSGGLFGAWLEPVGSYLHPTTAYRALGGLLGALMLAGGFALLALRAARLPRHKAALALALALLLPLAVNLPAWGTEAARGTGSTLAYAFLAVAAIMVFDTAYAHVHAIRAAFGAGMGILLLSAVIFSNQVYLKKNLEQQSTLSLMTRVVDRIERTEGYDPGYTPVVLLGSMEDSPLSVPRFGFEAVEEFDAASNRFAADGVEQNTWYMWEILGYPANMASQYETLSIAQSEEGRAMPTFPAEGSCRMLDGYMVVKLSD